MMLLSGHSAVPERKVPLESMSLTIKERDSTAEMVPADMTGIDVNSWLQDDTEPGRGIVWRVKSISNAYNTDTPKVSMEHAINLLKDRILFGEVKPSTITGNSSSTTCTALQAIRYILNQQSDWILDNFEYTKVYGAYKFDGDTLYDALVTVSNSLPDCWWSYDMNVYPFRLSITRKEDDPACEMRASRNLRTISKTIDKSGMFTRFYPIGYDDLQLPEKYIDRNTSVYGVICKTETNTSFDSVSELRGWANERLHDHSEPVVTITVEALELSAATGEAMDHLLLGAVCRVPLTEYNTTLLERITQISIPDKINQPEVVKLTLCNSRTDVSTVIAEILKSSSKSSRASTRQSKEDHAWIEDTSEHVSLTAKGVVGVDAQGNPNWTRLSQIVVDGTGIHQMVQGLQGDMVVANTKIEQNEYQITLEAQRASAAEGQLSGRITVEADRITQEVTARKSGDDVLSSKITVTASQIRHEVSDTKNSLQSSITQTASQIRHEVSDTKNSLQSSITQTASQIRQEVKDTKNGLQSSITATASQIRQEVKDTKNGLQSSITATANQIRSEVTDSINGVNSSITQTANQIRSEVSNSINGVNSSISQTANQIRQEVNDSINGVSASISTTANQIRAEVSDSINGVSASIDVSANQIRSEVVGKNGVISAINQTAEQIVIQASKINLEGYVKTNTIDATYIGTKIGTIASLTTQAITGTTASYDNIYGGTIKFRVSSGSGYTYTDIKDLFLTTIELKGPTNNQYEIWQHTANDATGVKIGTFSRAVTGLGYSWGSPKNGKLTVTANPQGYSSQLLGVVADGSWSGRTYSGKIKYYEGSDDEHTYETGATFTLTAPVQHPTLSGVWSSGALTVSADPSATSNYNITLVPSGGNIKYYYGSDDEHLYNTGATYPNPGAPSNITLWSNDSGSWVQITSPYNVSSQITVTPWCTWNGTDYPGNAITLTPKADPHHKVSDVKFAVAAQDMGNNRIKYTLTATIPDGGSSWIVEGQSYTLYV